uniref:Uncharacterized protein n=1 Tax=Panagrolaimus davidi TaxID=227884 RepID=A0A914QE35_9BILA
MSAAALDVIFRSKEGTSNTFKKDANTDFAGNVEQAKEKRFLSTGKTTTNINSKSFLSLHIAVHENSGELANFGAGKNFKDIKKAKGNFFNGGYYGVIQNAFEFPRQQENNEPNIPEVVEFRSSQRLLNPNSNAIASTASAIENVSSHNVPEIESNIINAPTPIENGNDLQINQLQAFEGEIAYSQKLRPTLLFFPRDAETYFCFCIPTKSRSAVFVQCRNCKNSKLWEVLDGRYFVTDPREGHNCTGIGAFQKFSEVRNNDFCHQLQQGIIEAESVEHLYVLYEHHMGVYLPHKTDEQKRDLKRALAKKVS